MVNWFLSSRIFFKCQCTLLFFEWESICSISKIYLTRRAPFFCKCLSKDEISNAAIIKFQWFIKTALFLVHLTVLCGYSSHQHLFHCCMKAKRATPIWAIAGIVEEMGKWENLVMFLRLLQCSTCHFIGWSKSFGWACCKYEEGVSSSHREHLAILVLCGTPFEKPHLKNTYLENCSGLGIPYISSDRKESEPQGSAKLGHIQVLHFISNLLYL